MYICKNAKLVFLLPFSFLLVTEDEEGVGGAGYSCGNTTGVQRQG